MYAAIIANGVMLHHISEYKDTVQQARANPPSQPSSSSSSSSAPPPPAHDRAIKIADVKKWHVENYNLEKRPRKINSWVADRPFEVFQADLIFFYDLRQREKAPKGKVKKPVDYVAGLLVVDTFGKKIAVVSNRGETKQT